MAAGLTRAFTVVRDALWRCLGPLRRWVPVTFVGFAVLNLFTFGVDLALLSLFYAGLHWPSPVAVTVAYAVAFGLSYVLNRVLNFEDHAPAGPQLARYVPVVLVNYLAFILGLGSGLTYLGVPFQLARLVAGMAEGIYMYCALRWIVFRDKDSHD